MPEYKWTVMGKSSQDREYLAFAELGERKSVWSFFKFVMRARTMTKQMGEAKGMIGYRARLEFLGKKVLMVAVFEDEATLNSFAHTGQHANCMQQTKPDLKEGMKYARWNISGSNIPPTLEEAMTRIQKTST